MWGLAHTHTHTHRHKQAHTLSLLQFKDKLMIQKSVFTDAFMIMLIIHQQTQRTAPRAEHEERERVRDGEGCSERG